MPENELLQLRNEIIKRFNERELKELCIELDIPWEEIPSGSLAERTQEIIGYVKRREELDVLIAKCKVLRPNGDWSFFQEKAIPFTNRQEELERLAYADASTQYLIVHAPAGYGKTTLLKAVEDRYRQKNWLCARIQIKKNDELDLDEAIATKLKTKIRKKNNDSKPGERFGIGIVNAAAQNQQAKGLALLIDLEGEPAKEYLRIILNDFIPNLKNKLDNLDRYIDGKYGLRVIIAGRYLFQDIAHDLAVVNIALSPFKYKYIRKSVKNYFQGMWGDKHENIASIAMCLGAGHPGCMAHIFKYLFDNGISPEEYLINQNCWQDFVESYANDVYTKMVDVLNESHALYLICLFRYMDEDVLKEIKCKYPVHSNEDNRELDEFEIEDLLTNTYLFSRHQGLIKDSIVRKLIVLHLYNRPPQKQAFSIFCKEVQEICTKSIKSSSTYPEYWVSEFFYQCLQEKMDVVIKNSATQKGLLQKYMFEEVVPATIKILLLERREISLLDDEVERKRKQKIVIKNLIEHLDKVDWELRFMFNYYLGKNKYDEKQFEQLLEKIKVEASLIIQETGA